jgi:hypothetical protein
MKGIDYSDRETEWMIHMTTCGTTVDQRIIAPCFYTFELFNIHNGTN